MKVARMSEATCGVTHAETFPGYRCAHPGYARRNPLAGRRRSEVRLVRHRHVIVEQMLVVLGTDFLVHLPLDAIVTLHHRPRRIEGIRVLEGDVNLHLLAAVDQLEALDDMQLVGMRRA